MPEEHPLGKEAAQFLAAWVVLHLGKGRYQHEYGGVQDGFKLAGEIAAYELGRNLKAQYPEWAFMDKGIQEALMRTTALNWVRMEHRRIVRRYANPPDFVAMEEVAEPAPPDTPRIDVIIASDGALVKSARHTAMVTALKFGSVEVDPIEVYEALKLYRELMKDINRKKKAKFAASKKRTMRQVKHARETGQLSFGILMYDGTETSRNQRGIRSQSPDV